MTEGKEWYEHHELICTALEYFGMMKQPVDQNTKGFDSKTRHKHFGDECKDIFVGKSEDLSLFNQDSRSGKLNFPQDILLALRKMLNPC